MAEISVILPVYNAEKYLRDAIQSILNQTFTDFELIIINDGSTDESERIINSFSDKRIRYIRNDKNLGLIETLNKAVHLAAGPYIARMDSDDISEMNRLEIQLAELKKNKGFQMICSPILGITAGGKQRDHW